jgi:carbonic anhydrase
VFDDLLGENELYTRQFALEGLSGRAAREFALVTCMDSRIEPLAMLGLVPGDAKILRNAGGRVTPDVLRSLVLATNLLGVRRIAVMQHTLCALAGRTDEQVRSELPPDASRDSQDWEFLTMPDPDVALGTDVDAVRACPLVPEGVLVEGWRYRVEDGRIDRVIPS